MSGGQRFAIGEADLHGLVDGRLDIERQTELLRRLRSHPSDRARMESWREQNDLLRATFAGIESEPLPVCLNLAPPPRLRCVASDGEATPPIATSGTRWIVARTRKSATLMLLGSLMGCAIIASAWWMFFTPAPAPLHTAASTPDDRLAAFAVDSLGHDPIQVHPRGGGGSAMTIPELGESGFGFKSATLVSTDPSTLVFIYENISADRLALAVVKADPLAEGANGVSASIERGRAILWRQHGQTAALAGTVAADRLVAIASTLRATGDGDPDRP